jgi:hypothetical protein
VSYQANHVAGNEAGRDAFETSGPLLAKGKAGYPALAAPKCVGVAWAPSS